MDEQINFLTSVPRIDSDATHDIHRSRADGRREGTEAKSDGFCSAYFALQMLLFAADGTHLGYPLRTQNECRFGIEATERLERAKSPRECDGREFERDRRIDIQ